MNKNTTTLAVVIGLLAAYVYHDRNRPAPSPTYRASGPEPEILADMPTDAVNLYYLTKPPSMVIPIRPFRGDDREFPKRHRYRDPQGPLADIYDPTKNRSN